MNNLIQGQFPLVTQAEAEAGILSIIKNWTPERMKQAIDALAGGGQTFARIIKKVDETLTNTTTIQDDDELLFTPDINKRYRIEMKLRINSNSFADFKFQFFVPTGSSIRGAGSGSWSSSSLIPDVDSTISVALATNNLNQALMLTFYVKVGGTAGNVVFQWAPNIVNGGLTKVLQGSAILVYEET